MNKNDKKKRKKEKEKKRKKEKKKKRKKRKKKKEEKMRVFSNSSDTIFQKKKGLKSEIVALKSQIVIFVFVETVNNLFCFGLWHTPMLLWTSKI